MRCWGSGKEFSSHLHLLGRNSKSSAASNCASSSNTRCLLAFPFLGVFHFFVHCFSVGLLPRYVLEFMCRCMCARVCMKHCSGAFITTANGSAGIEPCPASAMAPGRKGCIYFSLANTERCCCYCCCAFIDTARKGLNARESAFLSF